MVSSQPVPQVPWPNRATGFALRAVSSAHPLLSSSAAVVRSFQVFSPPLPIRWGWGHALQWVGLSVSCLGRTEKAHSGSSQIFLNRLSGQQGPGATVCGSGTMAQLFFCLGVGGLDSRASSTSPREPEPGKPAPCRVLWSDCTTDRPDPVDERAAG